MSNLINPLSSSSSPQLLVSSLNDNLAKLDARTVTAEFGDTAADATIIGLLPSGMQGMLIYVGGVPQTIIAAGVGVVSAAPGVDVLTLV